MPSQGQRGVILQGLLSRLPAASLSDPPALVDLLARRTQGFVGADLSGLCAEALATWSRKQNRGCEPATSSSSSCLTESEWEEALQRARPLSVPFHPSSEDGQDEKSRAPTFADLVGVDEEVRAVQEAVLAPLARPEALEAMGVPRSGGTIGVLLHGPPGTGKSTLGRALATGDWLCPQPRPSVRRS